MCSDDEESHIETLPMLCGTILAIGEIAIQITWAQLFKDQLALIRGRILIRVFFFSGLNAFCWSVLSNSL